MSRRSKKYTVSVNTPATGLINCGTLIVRELNGNTDGIGFQYSPEYLSHQSAFSIDPIAIPLTHVPFQLTVNNHAPGFLDDYLPDRWGRKVLSRIATINMKKDFNANSIIDILSLVSKSNIGAISIDPIDESASFDLGLSFDELFEAETAAKIIDDDTQSERIRLEAAKLIHLWQEGSGGVGGARPKSLICKEGKGYLAKFNSGKDNYNNARVEFACLLMAKEAGIDVRGGFVQPDVNGRDTLLLTRFDLLNANKHRLHLITINSMLKDKNTFIDFGHPFRYNHIHDVLKYYSTNIVEDLNQLLRLMLFNRAINNIDDHERNFSLVNDGMGYRLSPAYDLVPSLTHGQYHAAGYQYSPNPLKPSDIDGKSRILGVSKTQAKRCAEQVINAVKQWEYFAKKAGVSEEDTENISKVISL